MSTLLRTERAFRVFFLLKRHLQQAAERARSRAIAGREGGGTKPPTTYLLCAPPARDYSTSTSWRLQRRRIPIRLLRTFHPCRCLMAPNTRDRMHEAWTRASLLQVGSSGEPGCTPETRTSLDASRHVGGANLLAAQTAWLVSVAPSGISPYSTYRHNAISSFRATATMPIRRSRRLPWPNLPRYHRVRTLSG